MHIKTGPKRALMVLGVVGLLYGYKEAAYYGIIPRPDALKTLVPLKAGKVDAEVLGPDANVKVRALPSSSVAVLSGPTARWEVWEWNAQFGLMYANGGPMTTKNSLMEQYGAKVNLIRQDDNSKMQADQMTFAEQYCKSEAEPNAGVHFVTVMGDGGAQYIAPVNDKIIAYGPDCQLEIVGSVGYSRGEDKFMGLDDWKRTPQAARGGLVAGVLRDGDWNLAMRWAQENNVPNNPDDKVYDPQAINWVAASDYIDAAQKYVAGYCVDLPTKGKPSQKQHACVNGVVTWTPGDVIVTEKRGGLVTLMSTKDAIFQMPSVIIGNKKWDAAHADFVAGILAAVGQGADQVRVSEPAKRKAGEISTQVYHDQSADYWVKFFNGVSERDPQGLTVELGGSSVSNLADNFQLFGLGGGPNLFKATYEGFGNIVVQMYPSLFKSFPPASQVQNTRYLQMAAAKTENVEKGAAEKVSYNTGPLKEVVASRSYHINFETGSAVVKPDSFEILDGIANDLLTTRFSVIVHGFTDSTGTPSGNMLLSEHRADSVKQYLQRKGSKAPIKVIPHGQEDPVASNSTEQGRAANRHVDIVLGR